MTVELDDPFFDSRKFRFFREVTNNTPFVIRATVPINIVLEFLGINIVDGEIRVETMVGGTPAGTFNIPVPMFNSNNMTTAPVYTRQVILEEGGTHTGGTMLDVLMAKTADNSNFAGNVGVGGGDDRGVSPNTYYFRVTIPTATCRGVLFGRWLERFAGE